MAHENYETVFYRRGDDFRIAAIPGCKALMDSRKSALAGPAKVFAPIAEEFTQEEQSLPSDSTEIINTSRHGVRFSLGPSSWIQSQLHDG
jgi:hypothetical protein